MVYLRQAQIYIRENLRIVYYSFALTNNPRYICHEHNKKIISKNRSPGQKEKEKKRKEAKKRQDLYQKLKPLKDKRTKIEEEIKLAEKRKAEIETAFADQKTYGNEKMIQTLHIEYDRVTSQLDSLYDKWTNVEEKIEA